MTSTETVCSFPGCVSLATREDTCAVHGAGYRQAHKDEELRCETCHWKFRADQWYRVAGGKMYHVGACPSRGAKD